MNRLTSLWCDLALELGKQLDVDVTHDIKTVVSRVESEGFSFLTLTLPEYCSEFERALEAGSIPTTAFRGFRKAGRAPALLRGFLARIFDNKTGMVLEDPDPVAVWAVRQLSLFYKKIEMEPAAHRVTDALDRYIECDREVGETWSRLVRQDGALIDELREVFTHLFWWPLHVVDRKVASYQLEPRHGSGATANHKFGNSKWIFDVWPERFEHEHIFPYGEYALSRHGIEFCPEFLDPDDEQPVKVITVPKTQKTPRIIAEEPSYMMYMQQALHREIVPALESDPVVGPFVGFTDQVPNREMACIGSKDGSLATLDLKEASDRVPYRLVETLIRPLAPHLWDGMDACRSTHADVLGRIVRLHKFASMGSALCFPVEEMVFLAITFVGIKRALSSRRLSRKVLRTLRGSVRVYGDDIVVPGAYASHVADALRDYGLVVNLDKSFSRGSFRESCGGDYFLGEFITPVKARRLLPDRRMDTESITSWTATMNQLWMAGLWTTAESVRRILEGYVGRLPVVPWHSSGIGCHSFTQGENPGERMSPTLHVPQVRAWVARPTKSVSILSDWWALRKCFAGDYSEPEYAEHLTVSGRPSGAKLIRKWVNV